MGKKSKENKEIKGKVYDDMDEELARVLEEIENDPELRDVKAPDTLDEKVFSQIRLYEALVEGDALFTDEEKELMRLGKIYKKRKKYTKIYVLIAAAVLLMGLGITSVGGPKRVFEKVQGLIDGKEQINTDDESGQVTAVRSSSEVEAYDKIEKEFDFLPVGFDYKPEDLEFTEVVIEKETQNIRLYYEKGAEKVMICTIIPNFRTVTIGTDVEDTFIKEFTREVQGIEVQVKEYVVEESQQTRWRAQFQQNDVQYFLQMIGFTEAEMEKTIENLYFSK